MATQEQIRTEITNQIIEALEKGGIPPWRQPWLGMTNTGRPANVVSGKAYCGINPMLLALHQHRHGFRSRWYGTFNQWRDQGGRIMRRPNDVPPGEWGAGIIYYCPVTKTVTDPITGEESEEKYPLLKCYSVFSVDQVEGDHLDHLRAKDDGPLNTEFVDFEPAERAIAATEADIRYIGDRAFYRRDTDHIQVPPKNRYAQPNEFYSTCFHELSHWSEVRTDWKGDYAEGELRAEIAAAYMLAELGVPQSSDLSNHQAYLANWLQALRNDNKFIFRASTAANRAADYVLSFSHQPEPELVDVPF
jgi:antirestriction protein ArdC